MRKAPSWTEARRYPVTTGTVLLATAATIAWWMDVDMSALLETGDVRRKVGLPAGMRVSGTEFDGKDRIWFGSERDAEVALRAMAVKKR